MKSSIKRLLFLLFIFQAQYLVSQNIPEHLIKSNRVKSIKIFDHYLKKQKIKSSRLSGYQYYNAKYQLIEKQEELKPYKYKYTYNQAGLLAKKERIDNSGNPLQIWEYFYDQQNRLIKEALLQAYSSSKTKSIKEYIYDKKNRLIEIKESMQGEAYAVTTQKFYESNELYEKVYKEKYNKSISRIERYDKCGNRIYFLNKGSFDPDWGKHQYLNLCTNLSTKSGIEIDTLRKKEQIHYVLKAKQQKSVYIYDSAGHLIEEDKYLYKKNGKVLSSDEKSFDLNGKLMHSKELFYIVQGHRGNAKRFIIRKKFEYYPNGLLHKVHWLDKRNRAYRISEYKIEYR
ncbi:hypothetical protein BKI52_04130 [marine bacterium AO1-C]|nr:hypothetical protein BKI52_04130 [marine bacterium AO1-C]